MGMRWSFFDTYGFFVSGEVSLLCFFIRKTSLLDGLRKDLDSSGLGLDRFVFFSSRGINFFIIFLAYPIRTLD